MYNYNLYYSIFKMSEHPYRWYTGENHPMFGLTFMARIELDIILNPIVYNEIMKALPRHSMRIERGELYIQTSPGVYHSLYDEIHIHNRTYIVKYLEKCPVLLVQYVFYCTLKEKERRRLAAAI